MLIIHIDTIKYTSSNTINKLYPNPFSFEKGDKFIGKGFKPRQRSIWVSPFQLDKDGNMDQIIQKYQTLVNFWLKSEPYMTDLQELAKATRLVCDCGLEICYGTVLIAKMIELNLIKE